MTQYFGKSIDDHLFHVPQPSPEELKRLNPDIEASAVALRAAEDAERIKQRLSVPPELINHER